MVYDSIVIGVGPAGVEAAIYIKRSNFNVLVIAKDGGALEKAEKIENFYGQDQVVSGKELIQKSLEQLKRLGVDYLNDEVIGIEFYDKCYNNDMCEIEKGISDKFIFRVKTTSNEYIAKTVIIATGANRKKSLIKGINEFEGYGVSYCAICDGFLYKNKKVAVIGNGDYAISEVEALLPVTDKITILTNGKEEVLKRNKNVNCITKEIELISGNGKVEKILFKDNTELDISGIFIAEGVASSLDFARKLGAEIENNKLVVCQENMQTTIPGVFAAGDCTGEIYQIAKAVYEGMKAGLGIIKYLKFWDDRFE